MVKSLKQSFFIGAILKLFGNESFGNIYFGGGIQNKECYLMLGNCYSFSLHLFGVDCESPSG